MIRLTLAAIAAAALAGCAQEAAPVYPQAGWASYADPQDAGFDAAGLAALEQAVAAGSTQSMMVVKGGKVVFSHGDVGPAEGSYIASVRKSILTIMMGAWVERGVIDPGATLAALGIDDNQGLTDAEKSATVRDLIAARSGIYHPASNFSGVTEDGPKRGDHAPGTYYWYNNWDFNAAGGVFEELTGKDIYEAFGEQIAAPIGLEDFDLAAHRENGKTGDLTQSRFPAYHFFLSTRDLARIGLLMLREGDWEGEQIVPRDWVEESVSLTTPNEDMNPARYRDSGFGYGYMWWVFDPDHFPAPFHGGYAARGHFGQYIVVLPAGDLVIAHKTAPFQYDTPEEYAAGNVTWGEMQALVDLTLAAMDE